jgi:hypothetical protein
MGNPTTPITKDGKASKFNVQGIEEKGDKKVLPPIKVHKVETKKVS